MEHPVKFIRIVLVLLTICMTEGTSVQKLYRKLEPGHNILAIMIAEKEALSPIECSRMFSIFLPDLSKGVFRAFHTKPTGWTHIVMNYLGPNDGEGIRIYYNGQEVASAPTRDYYRAPSAGDDRIVVGRAYTDQDRWYTSMQMDELIFFNKALSTTEIMAMYNAV